MTKYYSVLQFNKEVGIIGIRGRHFYTCDDAVDVYCANLKIKYSKELQESVQKEGFDFVRVNTTWGGLITENRHCACDSCRRIGHNIRIGKGSFCVDCAHNALATYLKITFNR
ncbi:hypothetical protein D3C81_09280 [compost metagenome]